MVVPLDQRPRSGPYSGLTYRSAKRFMARQFEAANLPFADEDALDLLLGLTGVSQTEYSLNGTDFISAETFAALKAAADRRLAGEPVDRILGYRDFYGRRFFIDNVLSPRGDTEVLLLAALNAISMSKAPRLLDLGTGSGALAISILCERPDATGMATDIAQDALKTADRNAKRLAVSDRLTLQQSDWFDGVPSEQFDAVLSNPPYIDSAAMQVLDTEVLGYDPRSALHGGEDGLSPYRVLIPQAHKYLKAQGWFGVEIGYDQGERVREMFFASNYQDIHVLTDPSGHDRVVCARYNP